MPTCRRAVALLLAALLSCSGGRSLPEASASAVRGPQVALVTPQSVVIALVTLDPATSRVEYGRTTAYGLESGDGAARSEHVHELTGLDPDTTYHYRVLLDGEIVTTGVTFQTATTNPGAAIRFAVFGDSGTGGADQRAVAAQVQNSAPDLVLVTGDVVYENGEAELFDERYFEPYRELVSRIPFYPVLGNHDVSTDNGRPFLDAFYLPRNDEDLSERFYSFDRGDVHFVGLDSTSDLSPGSPQGRWLARDLAANTAPWTVVFLHHPLFSSSRHGSDLVLREDLTPVFDLYGVDLVFTGHDHVYERTYPMFGDAVVSSDQEPDYVDAAGAIYVVTGGGGRRLYEAGASSFTAATEAVFHHVEVTVTGPTLSLRAIRADGTVADRMTLSKTD